MDIKTQLLVEHSRKNADLIIAYIGDDANRFSVLMDLFFNDEYRVVQRAAHVLSSVIEKYPQLIQPYFKKIIGYIGVENTPIAVQRNILRLLQFVEVPMQYHGQLIDICFNFILDPKAAIAVRAFSMYVANNIVKDYPELKSEFLLILESISPNEPPAIKSRLRKLLKSLRI